MFFKKNVIQQPVQQLDLIETKMQETENLKTESANALDLVTSTIKKLRGVNENIDTKIAETNHAKQTLQGIEDDLNETKKHNEIIIEKFQNLIGIV